VLGTARIVESCDEASPKRSLACASTRCTESPQHRTQGTREDELAALLNEERRPQRIGARTFSPNGVTLAPSPTARRNTGDVARLLLIITGQRPIPGIGEIVVVAFRRDDSRVGPLLTAAAMKRAARVTPQRRPSAIGAIHLQTCSPACAQAVPARRYGNNTRASREQPPA
jgi:hypothetical protein